MVQGTHDGEARCRSGRPAGLTGGAIRLAAGAFLLVCGAEQGHAGAWTLPEGEGLIIATGLGSAAQTAFETESGVGPEVGFAKATISGYVDYGLTDWLTLNGDLEIASERWGERSLSRPTLKRAVLGGRVRVLNAGALVMSLGTAIRFEGVLDAPSPYGWQTPQLEARWSAGASATLFGLPAFLDLSPGYRHGFNGAPSAALVDFTAGVTPLESLTVIAQSFSTIGVDAGDANARTSHHKAQLSMVYDLNDRWSVQIGGMATLAGENAYRERAGFTALWYRF